MSMVALIYNKDCLFIHVEVVPILVISPSSPLLRISHGVKFFEVLHLLLT